MPKSTYRRETATWTAFGALFAFGLGNAVLGPALPYLRQTEGLTYIQGALHQVTFALGGLIAGVLAARTTANSDRRRAMAIGLTGAGLATVALGYGTVLAATLAAAFALSAFATTALIRIWAALADLHPRNRAVAMTEGEVSVSFAGIVAPLLIGGLAATSLTWRFSFATTGVLFVLAAIAVLVWTTTSAITDPPDEHRAAHRSGRTLVVIFAIVALEFTLSFWAASFLHDDVGMGRGAAASMISWLYAANLVGRIATSRLARRIEATHLLAAALALALLAMPVLLTAHGPVQAALGLAIAGAGIGATFPLASSIHVGASARTADQALGEILVVAAVGQIVGPLAAGVIAQTADLRIGLLVLPALVLVGGVSLTASTRQATR